MASTGEPISNSAASDRFTRRALVLGLVQAAGFAALGTRLYQLQVMDGGRYAPMAEDNRIDIRVVPPVRGRILDRSGVVVAGNDESFNLVVRLVRETDLPRLLDMVQRIVPMPDADRQSLITRAQKQPPGAVVALANDLTFDQIAAINLLAPQLPGVETETAYRRRYDHGEVTGHITGYLGRIERHAIDDDPLLRLPSSKVGKSGIERGLELSLRGKGGTRKVEVDARGRVVRNLDETEPVNGADVVLSIDLKLQSKVVARLLQERRASLVVIDVATGEVMAMGSSPGYDPASLTNRLDEVSWKALSNGEDQPLLNRAAGGLYPPGSTFKMVTALAALRAGVMTPKEQCTCQGQFELAGQVYRCWRRQGHGVVDLHKAIAQSCDVYFYEIANRTGIMAIAKMARELGLGQIYDCGLPQQKRGVIPDPDWKRTRYRAGWLGGETVLAGIGQGFVSTTPLQLAVMAARLATGKAVVPKMERPRAGTAQPAFAALNIPPDMLRSVREAMVAVVNEDGGTGSNAQLPGGGPLIAGKTGTSQVHTAGTGAADADDGIWEHRDHALFVSYFPAGAPRYALAAVVEHGGGGGATAAPLVRDVIEYLLADDPSSRSDPWASGAAHVPRQGTGTGEADAPERAPSDGQPDAPAPGMPDEDRVG
ncbi:MAG: penicillin-binding protein 2 [Hyphomicrobium sp.]